MGVGLQGHLVLPLVEELVSVGLGPCVDMATVSCSSRHRGEHHILQWGHNILWPGWQAWLVEAPASPRGLYKAYVLLKSSHRAHMGLSQY